MIFSLVSNQLVPPFSLFIASASTNISDPIITDDIIEPYAAYSQHNNMHYSSPVPHHASSHIPQRKHSLTHKHPSAPPNKNHQHRFHNNSTKFPPNIHHNTSMSHIAFNSPPNNNARCLLCQLCNNINLNPLHTTESCPLKDPTFIQHKGI